MMRYVMALVGLGVVLAAGAVEGSAPEQPVGQSLVVGLTRTTVNPPSTSLFLVDAVTGERREIYTDPAQGERVLLKIGDSDIAGAGRTSAPADVYVMRGMLAGEKAGVDTLSRLRIVDGERSWSAVLATPLSFSEAAPYGLWNRAPEFAVSAASGRVALAALRVGAAKMEGPAIRVLSLNGTEEWRIPLPGRSFEVTDLAWSPDGKQLAYTVQPLGDEHTLNEADLPKAGVYLAEVAARSTRLAYRCYGQALAWGPKADQVTVAVSGQDTWSPADMIRVVVVTTGKKVTEFSAPGGVQALAYTWDSQWLAAQTIDGSDQLVWAYGPSGGFGRLVYQAPSGAGRLSLLGWVEAGQSWSTAPAG